MVRPDLDKPEWGIRKMFEDGCGNLVMLVELSAAESGMPVTNYGMAIA